ncbi:MAG: sulfite exporter TauE/SafE family protein [Acidimicrobiia bacterium]
MSISSVAFGWKPVLNVDFGIALAGLIVGIVVGLTGMGGGALMTPILVIGFGIEPLAAVSSDLVAAVVMKPIGGGIHFRRGTVHTGLVRWLALGSVPGALIGSYIVSHLSGDTGDTIKVVLGVVLLLAASGMVIRGYLSARRPVGVEGEAAERVPVKRAATLAVGFVGGTIVGMTSVGSGSLMIVALMLLYPTLSSRELVGTDLVQAVPLVLAAAIGHLLWGEFELALTGSLLIGAVPGVIIGAHVSSRAPDAFIRPVLVLVLALSGLKLLDVPNQVLAGILVASLAGGVTTWIVTRRRARARELARRAVPAASAPPGSTPG